MGTPAFHTLAGRCEIFTRDLIPSGRFQLHSDLSFLEESRASFFVGVHLDPSPKSGLSGQK